MNNAKQVSSDQIVYFSDNVKATGVKKSKNKEEKVFKKEKRKEKEGRKIEEGNDKKNIGNAMWNKYLMNLEREREYNVAQCG